MYVNRFSLLLIACLTVTMAFVPNQITAQQPPAWLADSCAKLERELVAKYGAQQRARLVRGLEQVGRFWRDADGDAAVFESFVRQNFAGDQAALDAIFDRFQRILEKLDGHMTELRYELRLQADLDRGPVMPVDEMFAAYEPGAHLIEDFFRNKLAFAVLLNFPLTTLQERLAQGDNWTRRQWAETRLAERFSKRIPADVIQAISTAVADAELYVAEYKICMHHLLDADGNRPFPPGLRFISHWNLRDEIKALYAEGTNGLAKQRLIQRVMERIIEQSIPQIVINNPAVDWDPFTNEVRPSATNEFSVQPVHDQSAAGSAQAGAPQCEHPQILTNSPEPDTRYAKLLNVFRTVRKADPYSPTAPTLIARRFDEDRQMSEQRVKQMLEDVLAAPVFARVGRMIENRLARPLEPFDIWYNGFLPRSKYTEAHLDEIVRGKYPTLEAFRADLPNILRKFGFSDDRARFLQMHVDVEPARGSGHAMGGAMRGQKARLRTRFTPQGMDYKGFNIAMHELGHNIEQVFSVNLVDYTLLAGVPNTAFTEGFAMLLQGHDLEVLELAEPDPQADALKTLNDYWATAEIAGVGLVDIGVWHWMYEHPDATPAELKAATLEIAKQVWNRFYAPVFGKRDVTLLAVYSHLINNVLYLPDYPIGHIIAYQIEEQMKKVGVIGPKFERMAKFGNVAPDLWMQNATGEPVSAQPLLRATERALEKISK